MKCCSCGSDIKGKCLEECEELAILDMVYGDPRLYCNECEKAKEKIRKDLVSGGALAEADEGSIGLDTFVREGEQIRFLTNKHESVVDDAIIRLADGHDNKKCLFVAGPKPTDGQTVEEMEQTGMKGVYQRGQCLCDLCVATRIAYKMGLGAWSE